MKYKLQEAVGHDGEGRSDESTSANPGNKPPEDESQTGSTAVQEALANPLVLDCIFKNLRTQCLLRGCRLVNKEWNKVATRILKRRTDAFVTLNGWTNFEALEVCIEGSRTRTKNKGENAWEVNFPFREIHLQLWSQDFEDCPGTWLKMPLIRRFSKEFTRLRLTISEVPDFLIIRLLAGPFRHVESLTLNCIKRNPNNDWLMKDSFQKTMKKIKLEKLKSVVMGIDGGCNRIDQIFLTELLQCCPNLKRLENFTNVHLPAISKARKLKLVKSLRLCWCVEKKRKYPIPSLVETLIIANGNHEGYTDGPGGHHLRLSRIRSVLHSNRDSLQRLQVRCGITDDLKSNDWPKLSNLTSLELMGPMDFPASVAEIFPALKFLVIGAAWDYTNIPRFLGLGNSIWQEPLMSVTQLEVHHNRSYDDLTRISKAVPNVRRLVLHFGSWDMDQHGSSDANDDYEGYFPWEVLDDYTEPEPLINPWQVVYLFEHLEALHVFEINLPARGLDEFFIGIPTSRVQILKANPQLKRQTSIFLKRVLKERNRPSVVSLSGLKELIIGFTMSDWVAEESERSSGISHVAVQYGFNMAPEDMKIRFLYDHHSKNAHSIEEALRPAYASGRVAFGHWDAKLEN